MPLRWLSAALCMALVPASLGALEFRVTDHEGRPVSGANVSILGLAGSAQTAADGSFAWTPDPAPPFEVLVVLPSGRMMRPILVESVDARATSTPIALEVQPLLEETLTVTAGSTPHVESTPAAGTAVLSGREIHVRAPANLTQALENVAGVASVSEGQASVPAIRGLARGRTLILIDGARVTSERRVGPSATFLDPITLEAIEVSRGPGAVAYGSDAFGGVIDARTRGAEPGAGFGGRAIGELGAGVPQGRVGAELSHGWATGGVLVQGHYRRFDDYDSPEGEVLNSGSSDRGARARFDRFVGHGLLSVTWQSDLGRDVERPRSNSSSVRFYYPEENSHRGVASWEAADVAGFSRLGLSAFLGSYAIVTEQDQYATVEEPRSVERADVSARDFHVRGHAARALGGTRLELGIDVNGRYDLHALDTYEFYLPSGALGQTLEVVSIDDARRLDSALYASLEGAPLPRLRLTGGLRADHVTTRNRGGYFGDRDTANGAVSGFASVSAGPFGGFGATAQVSRGFRDPVLSDRYFRGPTGRGFITGNPDLESETSLQFDVALRYTSRAWRVAAYAYHYRIDDLIERYEDEPDFFYFRNRGRARLRGFEVEAQAELGAGFNAELAMHLVRGEALDDGTPLDDVPPVTLTARLTREFERGLVQLRGGWYADDERPGPSEESRDGYAVVDLAGSYELTGALELRLLLRNLLDETYLVSPDRRAVLAPGRSALLTAVVRF